MKLLVIILNKTDVLDYLLEGLSAAGIKGCDYNRVVRYGNDPFKT